MKHKANNKKKSEKLVFFLKFLIIKNIDMMNTMHKKNEVLSPDR